MFTLSGGLFLSFHVCVACRVPQHIRLWISSIEDSHFEGKCIPGETCLLKLTNDGWQHALERGGQESTLLCHHIRDSHLDSPWWTMKKLTEMTAFPSKQSRMNVLHYGWSFTKTFIEKTAHNRVTAAGSKKKRAHIVVCQGSIFSSRQRGSMASREAGITFSLY